jgi:hypothetical protein
MDSSAASAVGESADSAARRVNLALAKDERFHPSSLYGYDRKLEAVVDGYKGTKRSRERQRMIGDNLIGTIACMKINAVSIDS